MTEVNHATGEITGDPEGMARALGILDTDTRQVRHVARATAHLYIESPLVKGKGIFGTLGGMFQTHPPMEARIAALEEAGGFGGGGTHRHRVVDQRHAVQQLLHLLVGDRVLAADLVDLGHVVLGRGPAVDQLAVVG